MKAVLFTAETSVIYVLITRTGKSLLFRMCVGYTAIFSVYVGLRQDIPIDPVEQTRAVPWKWDTSHNVLQRFIGF